ncbi:GNAT family N-acetyltransferase [Virgisporangium aurantiacum]|uniref:N-acetyltransferase n=1 Tax=Virgisporangium aurantiacum TaxID=175570 RepID=A0A8J4E785_9ACTN|nr:GNAT family N-acetyltransferase [Virgisporangium aurantiacum]GIJ63928.1 N-acetyltransferase [Virgisporangium aurantiacum]
MEDLMTPRLRLRRWRGSDLDPMTRINADPEVMRWIGDGSVFDRTGTAAEIAAFEKIWDAHSFGRFAVELRHTGELAGFTGMAIPTDVPEVMPAVEIGWRLGRAFWGRGLATEAATAALRFAATGTDLDRVVGIHVVGNEASARVMRKIGMRFERETVETVYGQPVHVYAIDVGVQ